MSKLRLGKVLITSGKLKQVFLVPKSMSFPLRHALSQVLLSVEVV